MKYDGSIVTPVLYAEPVVVSEPFEEKLEGVAEDFENAVPNDKLEGLSEGEGCGTHVEETEPFMYGPDGMTTVEEGSYGEETAGEESDAEELDEEESEDEDSDDEEPDDEEPDDEVPDDEALDDEDPDDAEPEDSDGDDEDPAEEDPTDEPEDGEPEEDEPADEEPPCGKLGAVAQVLYCASSTVLNAIRLTTLLSSWCNLHCRCDRRRRRANDDGDELSRGICDSDGSPLDGKLRVRRDILIDGNRARDHFSHYGELNNRPWICRCRRRVRVVGWCHLRGIGKGRHCMSKAYDASSRY